jgi:hypothetical protein
MSGRLRALSLAGEAWFLPFTAGVTQSFLDRDAFAADVKLHGSSSGAFCAFGILNDLDGVVPFTESNARMMRTMVDVRPSFGIPLTNVQEILARYLDMYALDKDAYRRMSGRLFIGISADDGSPRIVSEFASNDDLKLALRTSAYIPLLFSTPKRWHDVVSFDGNLASYLHDFPGRETIKVAFNAKAPFYVNKRFHGRTPQVHGTLDIHRLWHVLGSVFPQLPPNKASLYGHGYERGADFLASRPDLVGAP